MLPDADVSRLPKKGMHPDADISRLPKKEMVCKVCITKKEINGVRNFGPLKVVFLDLVW